MHIKANAIREKGGMPEPFVYDRTLATHDVLVRITHCSVARGDIQFIEDDWGDTRFPLVPGHEIVGIVEEAGSAVMDAQAGDRVGIGSRTDTVHMLEFSAEHGIEAIVDVMPFDRLNEAVERVRSRDVPMGLVLHRHD